MNVSCFLLVSEGFDRLVDCRIYIYTQIQIATLQPAQDGEWQSVSDYFDEKAPPDVKKKVKTVAAKRNWITKVLLRE